MAVTFAFAEDRQVVEPEVARTRRQTPVPPDTLVELVEPQPAIIALSAAVADAAGRGNLPPGVTRDFFGGVNRLGVNHILRIGGADFSRWLSSAKIREGMNKDPEMTLTLDNEDFVLNDRRQLTDGHIVELSLFDGQTWRAFEQLKVLNVERVYEGGSKIEITARSRAVDLQYCDHSHTWKEATDSDVVREIAEYNGLVAAVEDTPVVHEEVAMGNEPASTLLNKLAERNGYEWGVDGKRLFFKKPSGVVTFATLTYRPDTTLPGSIISARRRKREDSKSGPKTKAKVAAADFAAGTVDPDTVTELGEQQGSYRGCTGTGGTTRVPVQDPLKESFEEFEVIQFGIPGVQEPVRKGEVRDDTVARSVEEAAARADAIDRTNAYIHELEVSTYGMVDLRIRSIIEVVGLSRADDGRWLVTDVDHDYTAREAYRMKLTTKAPEKPEGGKGDALPQVFEPENASDDPAFYEVIQFGIPGLSVRRPGIPETGIREGTEPAQRKPVAVAR